MDTKEEKMGQWEADWTGNLGVYGRDRQSGFGK